jgi:cholesterol transport system auxiliary component
MRKRLLLLAAVAAMVWGGACGAARPSKYYALEVPAGSAATSGDGGTSLLVGRITAPHVYRDSRIVYRSSGTEMGAYEYHRWVEPPPEMLEAMLVRALRASGKYQSVQHLRSNARGDYILRGRLHEFEEVNDPQLGARVVLEIELYDQEKGTVPWSQFYSHTEPVNGKDVPAVVAAFNRNVQRAIAQVTSALEQHFRQRPPQ